MANWGRRVNFLTWIALVCALVFWVIGLSGLAALSRIYQDPNNAEQLQWWIIWFQLGALFAAALVQYKEWFGARGVIMGLMCVLTAMLMTQTNVANYQRQMAGATVPYYDTNPLLQQTHDIAAAMASQAIRGARAGGGPGDSARPIGGDPRQQQQPGFPGGSQPVGGGSGGGEAQLAGGGGNGRRRLLSAGTDTVQRRANVVFLGFLFLTLADLALLVLFGVQHPHSKERSPRLYISSAVDQQQAPHAQYKDGPMEGVTLQVTAMPMRQGLKPENRTQSGVSLRFDGSRAASASVVPMRQPSRQLSGNFPFKLERMDSRQAARESPMREARVTRLGSRQMSDAGLLGIRMEGTPQHHQLPMAPIPCRQSLERV
ncbi:hypothetical protein WJX75_004233 [Coccomyxa subellipsoidea]|uniref:Uncharacterized protein n=1 Tax=Coccomyxa subellipsoidea TaxID=248742 RepID=A0ABR2Z3I2_9CHLO